MRKILLFCFIVSLFCGCNANKDVIVKKEKDITFNVGYPCRFFGANMFYNASDKQTYLYFAEPLTNKKIRIFDDNFKFVKEISTKDIPFNQTTKVEMISLDTALIKTGYSFYLINDKGKILDSSTLSEHKSSEKNDSNDKQYTYMLINPHYFINGKLYLKTGMRYQHRNDLPRDEVDRLSIIKQREAPAMMSVELFNPKAKREFYLYDFYKNIGNEKDWIISSDFNFTIDDENNKMIAQSRWSNKLFIINLHSMKQEMIVKIESDYTTIGTKPIANNNTFAYKTAVLLDHTNGEIEKVYFDPFRSLYYVQVSHTNKQAKEEERVPSWSLIIMNKQFVKIKEVFFKAGEYLYYGNFLITKQGILIPKINNEDEDDPTFTLFSVNFTD
ncbi:MAG: DUF4221 domain-containing protein [Bacteroidales bacterium]|jgi:hypothetical protein|nr:DUF4221 domain-containing protein [Bacteroidales bacterium]